MSSLKSGWFVCVVLGVALCASVIVFAQSSPPGSNAAPLRTPPTEKVTVNPGFRDWSPTTIAGATIVGGNQTGRGGIFAADMASGKVKWTFRPTFGSGTASVSTAPAIAGDVVITPFAAANPGATIAVSLTTGKELWRGPDPAIDAAVAVSGGLAYILGKDGGVSALETSTGKPRWKVAFATDRAPCVSAPIARDGTIYLTGLGAAVAGDASKPAGYYLFAIDALTGGERWRYRADAPDVRPGVCLRQPVVTEDTIFAAGDTWLYAVSRATGRDRWKPVEVRRPVDGRERGVEVAGLVDAGSVVVGMTSGFLIGFDKASGRTAWQLPGKYTPTSPATAVAGNVLYFQGSPDNKPSAAARGTLHALDLDTRAILWSFSRPTAEPNWPFGHVRPVDGGLWVDSYQALVNLR